MHSPSKQTPLLLLHAVPFGCLVFCGTPVALHVSTVHSLLSLGRSWRSAFFVPVVVVPSHVSVEQSPAFCFAAGAGPAGTIVTLHLYHSHATELQALL